MPMLKAERNWSVTQASPALSHYGSWLSWIDDQDLRNAMLATNINILRRRAPFAYLFANGLKPQDHLEFIYQRAQDSVDDRYASALDVKVLSVGVWLTPPDYKEPTTTAVTALLDGDVLPFVHFLTDDYHCLVCLPNRIPLDQIDRSVSEAGSNEAALKALLKDGGFHVHIQDSLAFSVVTLDHGYAEHFPISITGV